MAFTAAIENDPLAGIVTQNATSYEHAAKLTATFGQNGERVFVYGSKGERKYIIVNRDLAEVRRWRPGDR